MQFERRRELEGAVGLTHSHAWSAEHAQRTSKAGPGLTCALRAWQGAGRAGATRCPTWRSSSCAARARSPGPPPESSRSSLASRPFAHGGCLNAARPPRRQRFPPPHYARSACLHIGLPFLPKAQMAHRLHRAESVFRAGLGVWSGARRACPFYVTGGGGGRCGARWGCAAHGTQAPDPAHNPVLPGGQEETRMRSLRLVGQGWTRLRRCGGGRCKGVAA